MTKFLRFVRALWLCLIGVESLTAFSPSFLSLLSVRQQEGTASDRIRSFSTSCAVLKSNLEEDLDDALDNLLEDVLNEVDDEREAKTKYRIKPSSTDRVPFDVDVRRRPTWKTSVSDRISLLTVVWFLFPCFYKEQH